MGQVTGSFTRYGLPSAILGDPPVFVPLFAVTGMSHTETFHLPPVGTSGARTAVSLHDDTISLDAMLIGAERYTWKAVPEAMAESSTRGGTGSFIAGKYRLKTSGLILVTSMTMRTDMHDTSLTFSADAARRDALSARIGLQHVPPPGVWGS